VTPLDVLSCDVLAWRDPRGFVFIRRGLCGFVLAWRGLCGFVLAWRGLCSLVLARLDLGGFVLVWRGLRGLFGTSGLIRFVGLDG
jgi:hypothetical protein